MHVGLAVARRALAPLVALGILATGLAACSDGRGIFAPQRGIEGTWVRVMPPSLGNTRILVIPFHDTLTFDGSGAGRWSYEVPQADIVPLPRVVVQVALDPQGTMLFMNVQTCEVCRAAVDGEMRADLALPEAPRSLSVVPPPHFRIVRHGDDRLELRPITLVEATTFYERVSAPTPVPE